MGRYLNPGNKGFQKILQSEYVDKTGLIALINETIGTSEMLTCVSRPRRFGKSYAAKMLCAYYDCSCDSHSLFDGMEIAGMEGYEEYMNHYNVINLDITGFIYEAAEMEKPLVNVPNIISDAVCRELAKNYPELEGESFTSAMSAYVEKTGKEFVFIIDEWDALIREAKGDATVQQAYLNFLRGLFKNSSFTPYAVAAAYMTGILPIKKSGSQSAISDFREYTVLDPDGFAGFTGFTEREVKALCEKYEMSFDEAKRWYDGYGFTNIDSVYSPYSLMEAMRRKEFASYWKKTSAADSLLSYVNMDFEGLKESISRLIAGEDIEVRTEKFQNDFETFHSRDDVLTLLIHLGYLTWNKENGTVRIPNEEIRTEFVGILDGTNKTPGWMELINRSAKLLSDTLAGNEEAVAEALEKVHDSQYAPTFYNNEQALRYVVKFAYIAALDKYLKAEELPSGKGAADVLYIPKKKSMLPAIVVELKWNKTAEGALAQIKDRNYPTVLKDYGGEIVLVGISYDAKVKKHNCVIERIGTTP